MRSEVRSNDRYSRLNQSEDLSHCLLKKHQDGAYTKEIKAKNYILELTMDYKRDSLLSRSLNVPLHNKKEAVESKQPYHPLKNPRL